MKTHEVRVKEAKQRAAVRAKRSNVEQIALIAQRPGESKRELARLNKKVASKK